MAFDITALACVGPYQGTALSLKNVSPKLYFYSTRDDIATVNTSGYMNAAAHVLKVRDIVYVFDIATPTTNICSVLTSAGGVVDLSDGTPIIETDTD